MVQTRIKNGKSFNHNLHTFCYLLGSAIIALLYVIVIYSLFNRKVDSQDTISTSSVTTNVKQPQYQGMQENQNYDYIEANGHPDISKLSNNLRGSLIQFSTLAPSGIASATDSKIMIMSQSNQRFQKLQQPILLSENRPASSDVRGNLGHANVITNDKVENWLQDRWQAAVDMTGTAIPGEHWLEIDLQRVCIITKITIDWETAYSKDYTLVGRVYETKHDEMNGEEYLHEYWVILAESSNKNVRTLSRDKQHIIHEAVVNKQDIRIYNQKGLKSSPSARAPEIPSSSSLLLQTLPPIRFVRLIIHNPSTAWGSSVWRLLVYGMEGLSE